MYYLVVYFILSVIYLLKPFEARVYIFSALCAIQSDVQASSRPLFLNLLPSTRRIYYVKSLTYTNYVWRAIDVQGGGCPG